MSMKNSSNTIGNRTRDLPVCSTVPELTVPPHVPTCLVNKNINGKGLDDVWSFQRENFVIGSCSDAREVQKSAPDSCLVHWNVPGFGESIKLKFQSYQLTVYQFWRHWIKRWSTLRSSLQVIAGMTRVSQHCSWLWHKHKCSVGSSHV